MAKAKDEVKQSPTMVRTNELVTEGVALTETQRADGQRIYFTPPQEGVEFGTTVKATSLEKAQELTGVTAPVDAPADELTDNTDEGSK